MENSTHTGGECNSFAYNQRTLLTRVVMRIQLFFLIMLIAALHSFGNATAQLVSLSAENEPLSKVLDLIERQTNFYFTYKLQTVEDLYVTADLKQVQLPEALNIILKNLPVKFKISERTIIITRRSQPLDQTTPEQPLAPPTTITGIITNEKGEPFLGVTVRVKGTSIGTVTDKDGKYQILADRGATLVFTYVGYQRNEVFVTNGQTEISFALLENPNQLQETVIKGYYNTTKKLNTGSVSSITSEDLSRQPVSDPINALIGRIPGLLVQQVSGVPGRAQRIRLRGQNSLENGNEPLFIVDGIQYNSSPLNYNGSQFTIGGFASPFDYLNIEDIERIDVLKDADATALYGSRGANGVILITTKKGEVNHAELNLNMFTGFSKANQTVKQMNTVDYLKMRDEAFSNDKTVPQASDYDVNGKWERNRYTNWQDYLIGNSAPVTQASGSLNGGNQSTKYRLGATYRKEGTVFEGDFSNEKVSGNMNLAHKTQNDNFSVDFSGSFVKSLFNLPVGNAGIEQNIALPPNAPNTYNLDGTINWEDNTWTNPIAVYKQSAEERTDNLLTNLSIHYNILKDLQLKGSFGYSQTAFDQRNLFPYSSANPFLITDPTSSRFHQFLRNNLVSWNMEPQLSYSSNVGPGKLEALVGLTFQSSSSEGMTMTGSGFQNDVVMKNISLATQLQTFQSSSEYKYNAIYTRLGYNVKDKYIINLTGRRDGSSRFGPGKRFGDFGAIGVAWNFSDEEFLKDKTSWLDLGKLRVSYGTTGNDQIGDYKYLSTYTSYNSPYQGYPGYLPTQLTNPLYGWDRVNKFEIGTELGFFRNRFGMEISLYRNRTKNQLVLYALPAVAGFNNVRANIPAVLHNDG
jgi:TonB-dependent starch-binding outer membrane protein SusC